MSEMPEVSVVSNRPDGSTAPVRAAVVAIQLPDVDDDAFAASLAELGRLGRTLGVEVVATLTQKRRALDPGTVVGSGKLEELKALTVDAVLVDHDITPSQARNLEKETGVEVLDRTAVILEIFRRHARSRAAKAQVEIVRLQYLVPRLREQGKGQDRQRGGIGGKGAGESSLELDLVIFVIQAQQSLHIKKVLFELIAQHTGQAVEQVETDADRDRWFTAEQAVDYGFIDKVITSTRQVADEGRPARTQVRDDMSTPETSPLISPSMNYYIPQWEERTSYGVRRIDPFAKLFEDRIIFLGTPISDDIANAVMAQLLCLQPMDPDRDINIYINSPGGSFTALTAIYDTMQYLKPDIQTVCLGQAASAAAVLLAAGTPGKRMALPNSRILIHQPYTEGSYGQARTSRSRPTRSSGCASCSRS